MSQIAFRDGSPSAGTAFAFFQSVDEAVAAYLQNTGSFHTGDRLDLANYLATTVAAFRAHVPRLDLREDESQTMQGTKATVYIMTYQFRFADFASNSLNLQATTEIRVWTRDASPEEAGRRCIAVMGAIGSMIEQTFFTQSAGFDWSDYYAAYSGEGGPEVLPFATDRLTLNPERGTARHIGTFTWDYHENW
jgi:hypothetical protein